VCVLPPPVPVTTTVAVPTVADTLAVSVSVAEPEPGAAIDAGLNPALTPEGSPEADNYTAELKPPDIAVEIVKLAAAPWDTEIDDGAALTAKSGVADEVMVRLMLAV